MNWDAIGAIGEIVGAIAVVGSLAYLALQIRNSNRIELAQSERETIESWAQLVTSSYSPDEASIWVKGLNGVDNLTQEETWVFIGRCASYFAHYEKSYRMKQRGLLTEEQLASTEAEIVSIIKSPGGKYYWSNFSQMWVFRDQINEYVATSDIPAYNSNEVLQYDPESA